MPNGRGGYQLGATWAGWLLACDAAIRVLRYRPENAVGRSPTLGSKKQIHRIRSHRALIRTCLDRLLEARTSLPAGISQACCLHVPVFGIPIGWGPAVPFTPPLFGAGLPLRLRKYRPNASICGKRLGGSIKFDLIGFDERLPLPQPPAAGIDREPSRGVQREVIGGYPAPTAAQVGEAP